MEDFKQTLYEDNEDDHVVEVRSLKLNIEKKMTRTTMLKLGLTDVHVKMAVQEDRVRCLPLRDKDGHYI